MSIFLTTFVAYFPRKYIGWVFCGTYQIWMQGYILLSNDPNDVRSTYITLENIETLDQYELQVCLQKIMVLKIKKMNSTN